MNQVTGADVTDWEKVIAPAVTDFVNKEYALLTRVLEAVPDALAESFLRAFLTYVNQHCCLDDVMMACRRLGQNQKFRRFVEKMPGNRSQGLFLANLPNLKTRVSLSFFDHPKIRSKEVDYTVRLTDQSGKTVYERDSTIFRKQTHTFDCGEIMADLAHVTCGMFFIDSAEPHLGSLRVYACWYNDRCMTTTHEKSALATYSPLMIFPTVVSTPQHETYLAVTNRDEHQTLQLKCQLINAEKRIHPNLLNVTFAPSSTMMVPLTPYFQDMGAFLGGKPGALCAANNNLHAVYYYFIENKELGTWQIQHL